MYAQLGDIIFDLLFGFDKYDDTKETSYAQQQLINTKPLLQGTGEKLQEINLSIRLHTAFCVPEEQYAILDKKRTDMEVLTFVWGSGVIEGDFVIATLKKGIPALAPDGSIREMTCDLTLLEFFNADKVGTERKIIQSNAFATTLAAPHLSNVQVSEPSPATDVMDDVQDVTLNSNSVSSSLDSSVALANTKSAAIDKAQTFVDQVNSKAYQVRRLITGTKVLLTDIGLKLTSHPALTAIANTLSAQITTSQTVVNDAETLVNDYDSFPNPVTTLSDAEVVLSAMSDTVQVIKDLNQETKNLQTAAQPLAVAIATRKEV